MKKYTGDALVDIHHMAHFDDLICCTFVKHMSVEKLKRGGNSEYAQTLFEQGPGYARLILSSEYIAVVTNYGWAMNYFPRYSEESSTSFDRLWNNVVHDYYKIQNIIKDVELIDVACI